MGALRSMHEKESLDIPPPMGLGMGVRWTVHPRNKDPPGRKHRLSAKEREENLSNTFTDIPPGV